MLCSLSTGKSGSKWLDRLRSSKGFPAGNDLDLEQFLNHYKPDLSNSSDNKLSDANIGPKLSSISAEPNGISIRDGKQTTENSRENGEKEWFGVMNNVLAELFNMGDSNGSSRIHGKKSSRKQLNPKIYVVSTPLNGDNRQKEEGVSATIPSSGDNSFVETRQTIDSTRLTKEENANVEDDDEKCQTDLSGFTRTEVTVIDTSYPTWKCEKLLFRKKNMWRVRENKSKTRKFGIKKRKANVKEDENAGGEKKLKRCSSSKDTNGEQRMMPSNDEHSRSEKLLAESADHAKSLNRPVPEKRFRRKLKKEGSSIILIKSIPTNKKNGAIPKSCLKLTQRQSKA